MKLNLNLIRKVKQNSENKLLLLVLFRSFRLSCIELQPASTKTTERILLSPATPVQYFFVLFHSLGFSSLCT